MRGLKGFTVYLTRSERAKLDEIGDGTDRHATAVARRYIRAGIRQYERKQQREQGGSQMEKARCPS